MLSNKLNNITQLLISSLLSCGLIACVGNTNTADTTVNSTSLSSASNVKISTATISSAVESNSSLSSPVCFNTDHNLTLYSNNKEITATLSSCPTASYEIGFDTNMHWVQKEFYNTDGSSLILSFSSDVPSDFHLSQIYNDLSGGSENTAVGKIEQIDTSDCDTLIASGHTSGQSCKVQFVYLGLAATSSAYNDIHLLFSSPSNNAYNLDFIMKVANTSPSVQNYPILNVVGDSDEEYANYVNSITDNGNGMYYDNNYGHTLINNGTGNIYLMHSSDASIININTGKHFSTATNLAFILPGQETKCANVSLGSEGKCLFPFANIDTQRTVEYTRFTYMYLQNLNTKQIVSYSHFNVLGYGDILPSDYQLTDTESPILLLKNNYQGESDSSIIYNIPLDNLKFTAELNPQLNIATVQIESANRLYYAYGDYGTAKLQDLLQKISFNYDSSCFSGEFTNESQVNVSYACNLKLSLPPEFQNTSKVPFAFQLYASYDAPTGEHIKELIGTVSVNLSSSN